MEMTPSSVYFRIHSFGPVHTFAAKFKLQILTRWIDNLMKMDLYRLPDPAGGFPGYR